MVGSCTQPTGDRHEGGPHRGESENCQAEEIETANHIVELAEEKDVDFVILAGDTFEDHNG